MVLSFGIEGACGLIENQDRNILEQRTGDCETLPLSTRERGAALADYSIIAPR